MRLSSQKKKVTIHDVAALTGVSYQTVSRVINGMPEVSATTRARIQKVLAEVGFRPNLTARQLASKRSTTVGLVTFATNFYGPSQIMVNSEQASKEFGLTFMFSGILEPSTRDIRRAVDELCAHQVCGILIHLPWEVDLRDLQDVCRDVPIVAADSDFGFECPSVFINQELGSRKATRHLLQVGHKKVAHIRGPVLWRAAKLRYIGWQKELKAARLPLGPVVDGDWTAESGFKAAQELISNHWGKFTAIVVANDQMALGAIRAFEESSIRIPQKISLVGFDDIPEAGFFRPPLSTIKQDFASLGRLSIQCLMAKVDPSQPPLTNRTIQPFFIERASTAPPAKPNTPAQGPNRIPTTPHQLRKQI
ncbi:MAG: substrate-binding domain-containing protein [Verrucomicrobia bacterium]|nr:substrate-binding domain-containing protein [Verrucomicrobiota bacterium]